MLYKQNMEQEEKNNISVTFRRNWSRIARNGVTASIFAAGSYMLKNRYLAQDLFAGRESSNKLDNKEELFALRDTVKAEYNKKNIWGKLTSYYGDISKLSDKISEQKLSWYESFRKQSGISKAATLMAVTLALAHTFVFIKDLVKPSVAVGAPKPTPQEETSNSEKSDTKADGTTRVSLEEAKLLEEKQAIMKKNHGQNIKNKREEAAATADERVMFN